MKRSKLSRTHEYLFVCCRNICFKNFPFKVYIFTLALFSLVSLMACSEKTPEPSAALTVETLKNAEYQSEWPSGGAAKLTDGIYREKYMEGAASELVIAFIQDMHAFGDLDGDGVEDAAVILATSGGGSGTFISLEAVINDNGTPNHAASVLLGDRVQVKSVAVESVEITVDMVTHGPDDPRYRPTLEVTHKYKLRGDTLVRISRRD